MTKLETTLICVIAFILLAGGFAFYFEHRGEAKIEKADATVVAKAEVHNTQAEAAQTADDKKAGDKLNAALSDPVDALPSVAGLQPAACPSPVPSPRGNPSTRPAAPVLRAPETPSVVPESWSAFERSDVQSSHDADAEVTYLHTLLEAQYKLCGGKP